MSCLFDLTLLLWMHALLLPVHIDLTLGAYQSAGCSDDGCGVPCYLRPPKDDCHYTDQSTSPCDDGSGGNLLKELWMLNSTLTRLQNRIISVGDSCKMLPSVDHGGVIYSDLLITTGVIATYVCEEGYTLHGHGKYECEDGGVWFGNDTEHQPTCEDSRVTCASLVSIPNGHINYNLQNGTLVKPGDVVVYFCDDLFILDGSSYRVCLSNGSWTEKEPICIDTDQQVPLKIGLIFGVIGGLVLLVITCGIIITVVRKRCTKGYKSLRENVDQATSNTTSDVKEDRQALVETVH